jgi:hypothetical protein
MAARPDARRPFPFFLYQRRNHHNTAASPSQLSPSALSLLPQHHHNKHSSIPPPIALRLPSLAKGPKKSQNPSEIRLKHYPFKNSPLPPQRLSFPNQKCIQKIKSLSYSPPVKKRADSWPSGFPLKAHCKDHRMSDLGESITGVKPGSGRRLARAAAPFMAFPFQTSYAPSVFGGQGKLGYIGGFWGGGSWYF